MTGLFLRLPPVVADAGFVLCGRFRFRGTNPTTIGLYPLVDRVCESGLVHQNRIEIIVIDILWALVPSILFGLQTTITGAVKTTDQQRVLGLTMGGFIFALAVTPFLGVQWNVRDVIVAFVTGLIVGWGLVDQVAAFNVLGVSRTMPVSTGGQLAAISLGGVLLFGEWRHGGALPVGATAIIVLILGIWFVSRTEEGSDTKNLDWARGTRLLMTSTFAFSSYVLIGRAFGLDGPSILLPQATGYFLVALIAYAVDTRRKGDEAPKLVSLPMAQMTALGLMWGAAVVLLQVGAGRVGVATGFTLSQLGILISTPLGILWLGEHRVGRELCWTVIGVALVIVGAVLAGVAKGLDAA